MRRTPELSAPDGLTKLAGYPFHIVTWVDDAGYPVSAAVGAAIDVAGGSASFTTPAGLAVPADREVSLTGSHIRPQPGYGYDERRHVTVWGARPSARTAPSRSGPPRPGVGTSRRSPFFEYSERSVGQSRQVLRRAVVGTRDAGAAQAVVAVPGPSSDPVAVPHRDDHPGRRGHRDRRVPRPVRPADRRADGHRRGVRPARAQRRERRLRHHPGRRRRERHARPSSAAARASSSTASCRCARWPRSRRPATSQRRPSASSCWPSRRRCAAGHRHRRHRRLAGLHRAAAAVRVSRPGRAERGASGSGR